MRLLKFLLQKELLQIFRDPAIIRILFIMPMTQLLILPLAADYEIKNINLGVVDHDHSDYSQKMINKIISSGYFKLQDYSTTYADGLHAIELNKTDLLLEIPDHFERDLVKEDKADLLVAVDAINGVKGGLGAAYMQAILKDYNQEIRTQWIQMPKFNPQPMIEVTTSNWYNENMNYRVFMVPGILVMLVTMIGSSFAANNIVREKEMGTIEQINVSPIRKAQFILGKLIPFWLLATTVLTLGLVLARFVYGIVPLGSYVTIYIFSSIYLMAILGLGLLLSTYAQTQQQSMLVSFFVTMVFNLLSGLYTPIESMPEWAQMITHFNPVSYFIQVMRMVMLKGSSLADIQHQIYAMLGFAVFFNGWAIFNYRKRSG
ncbi:ABC-2 type transporter [Pseudopedobacter saltans DSM 12145]|uniref:ABC-2 type transporter n=1 Tax=Pseudopedobacter saltans (strain ATCC 51119 / DSM 12145 / JCM 21818 / CCUG 39354 / LMG 10337 / NBRC 100064 / NCIMB 13643) TaxID=762903 RepID=F0SCY8_PSESL|nr:ABC transporter permease [Pseudopedobacter saltans]ADY51745.1 ABC-2 type transporter [Pseudopedobacter saltans DSM 12145]